MPCRWLPLYSQCSESVVAKSSARSGAHHRCRSHVVLYATLYADVRAHIDRAVRRVRHAVNDDLRANGVHERADAANEPLGQCSAMFSEVNEQRTIDRMQLLQYSGE